MSSELRDLLDAAAGAPGTDVDVDALHARGRRHRLVARAAVTVTALVVIAGAAGVASILLDDGTGTPEIATQPDTSPTGGDTAPADDGSETGESENPDATAGPDAPSGPAQGFPTSVEPDPAATEDEAATWDGRTVAASELGAVASYTRRDGNGWAVTFVDPDGEAIELPIAADGATGITVVPFTAGVVWQAEATGAGSDPIARTLVDGTTATVIAGTDGAEGWTLVGPSADVETDGVLVEHRTGNTPDDLVANLVTLGLDGDRTVVWDPPRPSWEASTVAAAAMPETVLQLSWAETLQILAVDHPGEDAPRPLVELFVDGHGLELTGIATTQGLGVTVVQRRAGFPDVPDARLVVLDVGYGNDDTVVERSVAVPLLLGLDEDWAVASTVSAAGDHVVVNRSADGRWLPALVYDLTDGTWSVLERPGRAAIAPAPQKDGPPPPSLCRDEDVDRRNSPPTETAELDLYLPCDGETMPGAAYRATTLMPPSGDAAADAGEILEALLGETPLPRALRERGYFRPTAEIATSHAVTAFDDGLLTVDITFPEGNGNLSASHAGAVWHHTLFANLLQLDGVDRVRVVSNGDCDAYSNQFESDGCVEADAADAPWNRT